ncbi:hypothetical protein R6Q59_033358 [Mikania micrantha]
MSMAMDRHCASLFYISDVMASLESLRSPKRRLVFIVALGVTYVWSIEEGNENREEALVRETVDGEAVEGVAVDRTMRSVEEGAQVVDTRRGASLLT